MCDLIELTYFSCGINYCCHTNQIYQITSKYDYENNQFVIFVINSYWYLALAGNVKGYISSISHVFFRRQERNAKVLKSLKAKIDSNMLSSKLFFLDFRIRNLQIRIYILILFPLPCNSQFSLIKRPKCQSYLIRGFILIGVSRT